MPPLTPLKPILHFRVEIDGAPAGSFGSLTSTSPEVMQKVEPVKAMSLILPAVQSAGPATARFEDITLKRGYVSSTVLNDWIEAVSRNLGTRKDVSVVMLDQAGREQVRLNVKGALPKPACSVIRKDGFDNITLETFGFSFAEVR